jgi:hypothetical protein
MAKQCNQNVELNNQRELSSDAAAMKVEGVYDHKTTDMHEVGVLVNLYICVN